MSRCSGHTDDLVFGEAGQFVECVDHGVQGIGKDDAEGVGSILFDSGCYGRDDLDVGGQQIFPGHAGLPGLSGRDDDDICTSDVFIVGCTGDVSIIIAVGSHLHQVQGFSFDWVDVVRYVQDDDVSHLFLSSEHGEDLADLAASD